MEAGNILKGAAIGGAIAGAVNVILYFVGGAIGAEYMTMPPGGTELEPIPVPMPFVLSLVPALVGGGLLVGLTKFAGDKAWKIFIGCAVAAYLVMFLGPVTQFGDDMTAMVTLEVMHVVAVTGALLGIQKFARD